MKIVYNSKMNKLINTKINILEINDDILEINDDILEIDNNIDIYSDYYFYSIRVDQNFMNKELTFNKYLNISLIIWWFCLSKVKKKYNSKIFYLTIQYDDGSGFDKNLNNINEWFFIKLFSKEWFDKYFWKKWIMYNRYPYIFMKI